LSEKVHSGSMPGDQMGGLLEILSELSAPRPRLKGLRKTDDGMQVVYETVPETDSFANHQRPIGVRPTSGGVELIYGEVP